jgi:hypothetical protein
LSLGSIEPYILKTIKIYLNSDYNQIVKTHIDDTGKTYKLERSKRVVIPSKKNQRTPIVNPYTGKAFLKHSNQYIKWKKLTKGFWEAEYWKLYNDRVRLPIVRCKVNIIFYFSDEKDRDCTNKAETIMDALVEHKILADDNFKVVGNVCLNGFLCRDRPRTEVYITILDPGDPGYEYDVTDYAKHKEGKKKKAADRYKFNKQVKKDSQI